MPPGCRRQMLSSAVPASSAFLFASVYGGRRGQRCIRTEGASEAAPEAVRLAVEEGATAVGVGYCWFQMPLKLALAARRQWLGQAGFQLRGGVDRAPWLDPPP